TRRVRLIQARPPGALGPCSASAPTGQASQRPPNPPGATSSRKRPRGPDPEPRPTELCEVVAMGSRTRHFAELAPAGTELAPAGTARPTEFCERVAMGLRPHHFADVACRAVPRADPGRSRARRRSGEPTLGQRPTWTF